MDQAGYWSRSMGRRLSRRGALRGTAVAGLGLAGAALIGCGGEDDEAGPAPAGPAGGGASTPAAGGTTQPAAAGDPVRGGTYRPLRMPGFTYQHLDPTAAVWTAAFTEATHSMLVRMNNQSLDGSEWEVEPEFASSWEEPDDSTYVFHLEKGVKFHDIAPVSGRVATSEDVKFSLERIATPQPQFFRQKDFAGVEISTPDETTVVLKFPRPLGPFWNRITTPGTVVLPAETQEIEGDLIRTGNPLAGTGPFIHEQLVQDTTWKLKRNPEYFRQGLPYIDAVDALPITQPDAQFVSWQAGDTPHVFLRSLELLNEARKIEGAKLELRSGTLRQSWIIFHTEKPPYDDVRIRRAISLVHPRQEIVDVALLSEDVGLMLGPGGLKPQVHGSATYSYEELKTRPGYRSGAQRDEDVTEAKKLLDAAGFTGLSGPLKYTQHLAAWPYNDTIATLLTDALREVGFDFTLEPYMYSDTLVNLANRDFDIYHSPQDGNGIDPNDYLSFYFAKDGVRNYGAWRNTKFDELMEKQTSTTDKEERNAIILDIVKLLEEENPRAPTYSQSDNAAYWDWMHNWWIGVPSSHPPYDRIWQSK